MTPAHLAAEVGHIGCLDLLLKAGANIEAKDDVRLLSITYCCCDLIKYFIMCDPAHVSVSNSLTCENVCTLILFCISVSYAHRYMYNYM